jgi:hypothetical protein
MDALARLKVLLKEQSGLDESICNEVPSLFPRTLRSSKSSPEMGLHITALDDDDDDDDFTNLLNPLSPNSKADFNRAKTIAKSPFISFDDLTLPVRKTRYNFLMNITQPQKKYFQQQKTYYF